MPFDPSQDYCTFFPERIFGIDLAPCCYAHDMAYESGGVTLQSHIDLGACVIASGGGYLLAGAMVAATTAWWLVKSFFGRAARP